MPRCTPPQLRQRIGGLHGQDAAADANQLRAQLREAKTAQYIQRLLDQTPPLSADERQHLTRLLTPPARDGGRAA